MSKEYKERKKRTIHNQRIHVRPIGYCHCDAHIGYVTVELMRKREPLRLIEVGASKDKYCLI